MLIRVELISVTMSTADTAVQLESTLRGQGDVSPGIKLSKR